MKITRKIVSLLLALMLGASAVPTAFAAEENGADAANALYTLGLLAGKGTLADGSINFDLSSNLTRAESITQVVRFLGAEKDATANTNTHPFTDLLTWAVPYISYAYANGITAGVSATKFDCNSAMSDYAFLTAILRVLGYKDAEGDFSWNTPYALAKTVGLIENETPDTNFTRGDAFVICFNALTATVKSGDKICDRLVKSGAVNADVMNSVIGSESDGLTVGNVNITKCKVVISASANATEKLAANTIINAVKTAYGVTLELVTDETPEQNGEIVVGNTARNISKSLETIGEDDAAMFIAGSSVAIGGANNSILRNAASAFATSYIKNKPTVTLTEANNYTGGLIPAPVRALGQSGDPCIVYDNETGYYYAIYSAPKNDRVILYRAKTLAELGNLDTSDGKEIYVAGENAEVKHKLYAPELKKMDGKWYIYASGATSMEDKDDGASKSIRLFCLEATSADPYGEYKFKAFLNDEIWAIDAHPFTYEGQNYIAFARIRSGNIISIAKLANPWTIDTESKISVIATPTYDFETVDGNINEGPFTFVSPEGRLFMLYSANGVTTGKYCLGILEFTGDDILSKTSWTKHKEAIMLGTDSIKSPGHCSVFMSPDSTQYWVAYHYQSSGRKLAVNQLTFDETGFPYIGEPTPAGTYVFAPSGE